MKIINAMFSKVNGGLEQVFLNYTKALTDLGHTVLSVIHPKAQIRAACPQDNLKTIHNLNQHDFMAVWRLRRLIEKEQPQCIITHSYRAAYLFKKTNTQVPKIAVCHVKGHYDFGLDALIALTSSMRQDIITSGQPPHTVFTVPNMIAAPSSAHKKLRETKIPVIGACARFAPIKGIDVLICALAELKKCHIPFKARIAGDGPERSKYESLIKQLHLEQEVELLGWIEDRHAFYQSLDIFCLPSREESFGLVVLESMTHSLPMVLSQLSGPQEIIGQSQAAVFVPPEDPKRIADALIALICDPTAAKELGARAFERVQHYSDKKVGVILQEVINQVIQNKQVHRL